MKTLIAVLTLLLLTACGKAPCVSVDTFQKVDSRCGMKLALTTEGYAAYWEEESGCTVTKDLPDGQYFSVDRKCHFFVSNGGTEISIVFETQGVSDTQLIN